MRRISSSSADSCVSDCIEEDFGKVGIAPLPFTEQTECQSRRETVEERNLTCSILDIVQVEFQFLHFLLLTRIEFPLFDQSILLLH